MEMNETALLRLLLTLIVGSFLASIMLLLADAADSAERDNRRLRSENRLLVWGLANAMEKPADATSAGLPSKAEI